MLLIKRLWTIAAVLALLAGCGKTDPAPSPEVASPLTVDVILSVDNEQHPTTRFARDTGRLHAFFHTKGSKPGDALRAVWIATDVGKLAPNNTKIDQATLAADSNDYSGVFWITRPDRGWPPGQYKIDIYINDTLRSSTPFGIE